LSYSIRCSPDANQGIRETPTCPAKAKGVRPII
jgi:hypothetical protein